MSSLKDARAHEDSAQHTRLVRDMDRAASSPTSSGNSNAEPGSATPRGSTRTSNCAFTETQSTRQFFETEHGPALEEDDSRIIYDDFHGLLAASRESARPGSTSSTAGGAVGRYNISEEYSDSDDDEPSYTLHHWNVGSSDDRIWEGTVL